MTDLERARKIYHSWQGKKYDLHLNFLPMQIKVQSESRKRYGLFMLIGICRCLASGDPLWYLASILVQAQSCVLFPCRAFMMKLKILICDHHTRAISTHRCCALFYLKDLRQRFLFCFLFKTSSNVSQTSEYIRISWVFRKMQIQEQARFIYMKQVRRVVIFAGVMTTGGMGELSGVRKMQYMCKVYQTLHLGTVHVPNVSNSAVIIFKAKNIVQF